ncbi:MAG: AAA family ATPase [Deltaproteobacteria bacterium]|jgi:hypothetical protein|nr:AAA family ATPase [Deltaproteobacteria bacterium]
MTTCLKQISTGCNSIRELIENNRVYVDKTELLLDLIKGPNKSILLTRPRHFGKSLILDTIEEIFSGDRSLFEGLQIDKAGYDFPQYPVLRLDMGITSSSTDELELTILNRLKFLAEKEELTLKSKSFGYTFKELIKRTCDKHQKNVVVLIDDYDCPVSSVPPNTPLAEANILTLSDFYAGLKTVNNLLRFTLVTGVTRIPMAGLSTALNNLDNISLDKKYAAICGFTPEELDQYFSDHYPIVLRSIKENDFSPTIGAKAHLSTVADLKAAIINWSDGYSFAGQTKVLNPLWVLNFFKKHSFKQCSKLTSQSTNFPTSVTQDTSSERPFVKLEVDPMSELASLTPSQIPQSSLFFKTGYLSVTNGYVSGCIHYFNFNVPNNKLNSKFYKGIADFLFIYLVKDSDKKMKAQELEIALLTRDAKSLARLFFYLFQEIPTSIRLRGASIEEIDCRFTESFHRAVIWAYCRGLLSLAQVEKPGGKGAPQLIMSLTNQTYAIIELKYARDRHRGSIADTLSGKADQALKASQKNIYGERLRLNGQKVVTVGVGIYGQGDVEVVFGGDSESSFEDQRKERRFTCFGLDFHFS